MYVDVWLHRFDFLIISFVDVLQQIVLVPGEEHGAVSAMSGHDVTLSPSTQNDAELPQHRQRATHYKRGRTGLDQNNYTLSQ